MKFCAKEMVSSMLFASATALSAQTAIAEGCSAAQSRQHSLLLDHPIAVDLIACAEYRRDWSNQRHFLSDTTSALLHARMTATLGLVHFQDAKQGSW